MSNNPLSRYLTERELALAAEYEASTDPERRDAIRRELYNLRWRLNNDSDRKYHETGNGKHLRPAFGGESAIYAAIGGHRNEEQFNKRLDAAVKRLESSPRLKHTVVTLLAVVAGGGRRNTSIRELMAARHCSFKAAEFKYDRDMKTLLAVFE